MSFLNPVSEPVLRFSSTDAGAPQINYNARTAGDVKAVLKACLVTGYGATESARWLVVNEVDHVCEFVSPDVALANFKLKINDASASTTNFSYVHNDAAANVITNNAKSVSYTTDTAVDWVLITTNQGFYYIELINSTGLAAKIGRLLYFGTVQSALVSNAGESFITWCYGWGTSHTTPTYVFRDGFYTQRPMILGSYARHAFTSANSSILSNERPVSYGVSTSDLWSAVYIEPAPNDFIIGKVVGILFGVMAQATDAFRVDDIKVANRDCFTFFLGNIESLTQRTAQFGFNIAIYTDKWES